MEVEGQKDRQSISISGTNQQKFLYNFYSVNQQPNSLVMLKSIPEVLPLLVIQPIFIFVNLLGVEKRLQGINVPFLFFMDIQTMNNYLKQKLSRQYIELIAPLNMVDEIGHKLGQAVQIKKIHLHMESDDPCDLEQLFQNIEYDPEKKHVMDKLGYLDIGIVIEKMKNSTIVVKNSLPNIIYLNEDGWKASIQLRTMFAMINQQNTNKESIMKQFYQLFRGVYGGSEIHYKEFSDIGSIIKKYTENSSPENYLTNNLLRASKNPSELYYCQPYLRVLFQAINKLYLEQRQTLTSSIICYRGGSASEREIQSYKKHKGQIIQSLGFLSTSLDVKIGEKFAKNVMFVITITNEERDSELDFGYANISQYSHFPDEQEILFNPLNTFRIQNVSKHIIKAKSFVEDDRQVDTVYLTYGSLAKIRYKRQKRDKLDELEQQYANQAEYLVKDLKYIMKNQGDAFISSNDCLQGGLEYYEQQMKHENNKERKADILSKLGKTNQSKGRYKEAIEKYQECLIIQKSVLGKGHPNYAATFNDLGTIYMRIGKYQQAFKSFGEGLSIQQSALGKNHSAYTALLNNIGSAHYKMGTYQKALNKYQESLNISEESFGKSHLNYVGTLNNIGSAYYHMGRYEEALKRQEQCLQILGKVLGKAHPDYGITLSSIGSIYLKIGKYEKALKNYHECLILQDAAFGRIHRNYASTLGSIGLTYYKMGKYEKALSNYENCLILQEKIFGQTHPDYIRTLSNIGLIYDTIARYEEALDKYQKCLVTQRKLLGESHPEYAGILNNIGSIYDKMGQYQKALKNYHKCLSIQGQVFGNMHPSYAITLSNIGSTYYNMGMYQETLKNYQECQDIRMAILGKAHPSYGNTLSNIGSTYHNMERYEESLIHFQYCQNIIKAALGKNHPQYAITLNNIAMNYSQKGLYQQALAMFQQSLRISQNSLGKQHPQCISISSNLQLFLARSNILIQLYHQIFRIKQVSQGFSYLQSKVA